MAYRCPDCNEDDRHGPCLCQRRDEAAERMPELESENEELHEALSACRGQWIHSVNRQQCLAALGEEDEHPCTAKEHWYCRGEQKPQKQH